MKTRLLVATLAIVALVAVGLGVNSATATGDVHHPACATVTDIPPGAPTPIGGIVYVKAGNEHYNVGFHAAGYVAGPQGGHAVSHVDVCPGTPPTVPTSPPTTPTTPPTTPTTPPTDPTTPPTGPTIPTVPGTDPITPPTDPTTPVVPPVVPPIDPDPVDPADPIVPEASSTGAAVAGDPPTLPMTR